MKKRDLLILISFIVVIVCGVILTYIIVTSDLPDWLKYLLLK